MQAYSKGGDGRYGRRLGERWVGARPTTSGRRGPSGVNSAAYSAAKAGLTRLTQVLALEWAPYGVNVNAIAPGIFPDPVTSEEAVARAAEAARSGRIPLRRPGNLREVGLLTHFLLSDAASYITGETVYIDGGIVFA